MGEEIKEIDLDWTHWLGTPKDDKVRPITVECNTRRRRVFRNEKELGGKRSA